MLVSRRWLSKFFPTPTESGVGTPTFLDVGVDEIAEALTFHAFEIDGIEKHGDDDVLDVKVTPNRGHDCLSHRGIARELSAILNIPFAHDPFEPPIAGGLTPTTKAVSVSLESPLCRRYIAGYLKGVRVGPSPAWLRRNLEVLGQRSVNNVVDATNFVMFNTGQPLHAFDAGGLTASDGAYAIAVRGARAGEQMMALDDKEYTLDESMMVIADRHAHAAIGVAGVKGGKPAGITEATVDIIIESANFDGTSVRKTAQALKLRTDASTRFEQGLSPELAAYGMRSAVELIQKLAGGELVGFTDAYPEPQKEHSVSVSLPHINQVLGTSLSAGEVEDVFNRLGLSYTKQDEEFTVAVPWERLDLDIPEDVVEEVARMRGYDEVPAVELPPYPKAVEVNKNFYTAECVREELTAEGYSEVYTSVFADVGERAVLNKVGGERPFLRTSLQPGLADAWLRNTFNKDLLGLKTIKIFEIGTVWKDGEEIIMVGTAEGERVPNTKGSQSPEIVEKPLEEYAPAEVPKQYESLPVSTTEKYKPFSKYPYIVRDIAMWVPAGTDPVGLLQTIRAEAGELCVEVYLFDTFKKREKTSLAYRLIFQSYERTLEDKEANEAMEGVYKKMQSMGFEIR